MVTEAKSFILFAPGQSNTYLQDPQLRSARQLRHVKFPEPSRDQEKTTESEFLSNKQNIEVGSCVFLDRKAKTFSKSFELQVSDVSFCRVVARLFHFMK